MVKWESGIDRIADLRLLPAVQPHAQISLQKNALDNREIANLKYVELDDEW